jgi:hypothetical protein
MSPDMITVGIVSWYSGPLLTGLMDNLRESVDDSELKFVICDNTGGQDKELYDLLSGQCEILPLAPDTSKIKKRGAAGSVSHGQGLNFLFERMDTSYGLFIDPDCLLLQNAWDLVCKRELTDRTLAIGSPYHSSRFVNYQGFPTAIYVFFRVRELKQIHVDWSAYGISLPTRAVTWVWNTALNYATRTLGRLLGPSFYVNPLAEWFKRTPLCGQHRDTGWRVPRQVRVSGYTAQVFTPAILLSQLYPSCSQVQEIRDLMADYELFLWKGVPILTHFYSAVRKAREGTREEQLALWKRLAHSTAMRLAELPECRSLLGW